MNLTIMKQIANMFKGLYCRFNDKDRQQLLHIIHNYDMLYHSQICKIITNNWEPKLISDKGSYYENNITPRIGDLVYFKLEEKWIKGIIIAITKMITLDNANQYPNFFRLYGCKIKDFNDNNHYCNTKNIYKNNFAEKD